MRPTSPGARAHYGGFFLALGRSGLFGPDKSRPAQRRLHAAITDEGAASGDGGPTRTVGLWSRRIGVSTRFLVHSPLKGQTSSDGRERWHCSLGVVTIHTGWAELNINIRQ